MPNRPNTAMLNSVSAMPSCPSDRASTERIWKVENAGKYAYPNIGSSQWIGSGFAFGPSASFFGSGSSLSVGAWNGLSVLFLSDIGGTALKEFDVNTDEAKGGGKFEGKRYGFSQTISLSRACSN